MQENTPIVPPLSPDYSQMVFDDEAETEASDSKYAEDQVEEKKEEDKPVLPTFVIGQSFPRNIPTPTPKRVKRKLRKSNNKKIKKAKKSSKPYEPPAFPLSLFKFYEPFVSFTLLAFPKSSVKAVQHFHKIIAPPTNPDFFSLKPEQVKKLADAFYENIRARWAFRKLYILWLSKRCRAINEEDPMTLEPIKEPVEIYSLKSKAIYRFESKSLAYSFRANLLNHNGIFPEPRMLTNPLTNLPLSEFQTHSIIKTLRKKGQLDWVLDSFFSCKYRIENWQRKFDSPLKVEALENVFSDKSSPDKYEMLMDFVELQYDINDVDFPRRLFHFIFTNMAVEAYANEWEKVAKKFYLEKLSLNEQSDIDDLEARSSIDAILLIPVPNLVKVLYDKYLEDRREDGRRRIQVRYNQGDGDL